MACSAVLELRVLEVSLVTSASFDNVNIFGAAASVSTTNSFYINSNLFLDASLILW